MRECYYIAVDYLTYHDCFGISTQRVLKQSCEFRVSVWNMSALSVYQGRYNIPQGGEGQVDLCRFLQPLTCCTCLGLSFWSLCDNKKGEKNTRILNYNSKVKLKPWPSREWKLLLKLINNSSILILNNRNHNHDGIWLSDLNEHIVEPPVSNHSQCQA